ncbi:putative nuclease HARBI1 [Ixodes scapularis]
MSNARNRRHRRERTDAQYAAAMMRRQRVLRDRLNPFEDFDEDGLQQRFRFGRAGIMFLADTLRPDLERRTRRSRALSAEQQVIIALQFYATRNFLITAGDYIRVHVSSASRAVRQVTVALARRAQDFIRWPDAAEGAALQHKFYDMAGFPLVVGAVDGTHVRIQAPHVHEEAYVNRHGYHSINVQVVVDASSRIRNVVARWPGSTHDSRIFTESTLAVKLASGEYDGLLLGDSGYSCQPWLMTPFLSPHQQPSIETPCSICCSEGCVCSLYGPICVLSLKEYTLMLQILLSLGPSLVLLCSLTGPALVVLHNRRGQCSLCCVVFNCTAAR